MRALVTGHLGFIGRHVWRALERRGYDLTGIDAKVCIRWDETSDARDLAWDDSLGAFDLVVHCAALVDGRETIEAKAALVGAYNLQLDGALFEWALRARPGRIIYFSSSAAYPIGLQGPHQHKRLREDDISLSSPAAPDATYGWVKLTGELLAHEVRNAGVPVTIVRPFSGYGEDQDPCYPFPAIIARARRGDSPFEVWGDGQQVRDFIHVDDIAAAILALVDQQVDGPVNLGTGILTSIDDLARLAMRIAGYSAPIRHLHAKPAGVQHRVADTTLMRRYYEPTVTLADGVARALR